MKGFGILQLQKATTKPKEFAVSRIVELSSIYPTAKSKSSISRKNSVNQSTHELRMAAMVKMTVSMNHAQQYIPSALLKSDDTAPVFGSVYARFD
jgi:hypothetical protein